MREHLDLVVEKCESNKAVIAVLLTLMLKKTLSPEQDIRNHQQGLPGGFSGRSLDEKTVTPFLKARNFPAMQSGSGWLTRSLEQKRPYDMNYPGAVSPKNLKQAFLGIVHEVEVNRRPADAVMTYILAGLIEHRNKSSRIKLSRPTNLTINQILALLRDLRTPAWPVPPACPRLRYTPCINVSCRKSAAIKTASWRIWSPIPPPIPGPAGWATYK
ncbi:MAG: hypothetical protein OXU88_01855 [Gammaproteobacteria bacterium]|nr:hypothetical protein [Gammaproteobacteria bacterium]